MIDYQLAVGLCRRFAWCNEPSFIPSRRQACLSDPPPTVVTEMPFGTVTVEPVMLTGQTTPPKKSRWRADVTIARHNRPEPWVTNVPNLGELYVHTLCQHEHLVLKKDETRVTMGVYYRHTDGRWQTDWDPATNRTTKKPARHWQKGWWLHLVVAEYKASEVNPHRAYWHASDCLASFRRDDNILLFDEAIKTLRHDKESLPIIGWLDRAQDYLPDLGAKLAPLF